MPSAESLRPPEVIDMLKTCLAAALSVALAGPALAKDLIRCSAPGKSPVTIDLAGKKMGGRTLACISGGVDIPETCAPDGGFGMHYSTGSGQLRDVFMRWQQVLEAGGGAVTHLATSSDKIAFTGGYSSGSDITYDWTFTVDRVAGSAKYEYKGSKPIAYSCGKSKQKF